MHSSFTFQVPGDDKGLVSARWYVQLSSAMHSDCIVSAHCCLQVSWSSARSTRCRSCCWRPSGACCNQTPCPTRPSSLRVTGLEQRWVQGSGSSGCTALLRVLPSNSMSSAAIQFPGNRARAEVSVQFGCLSGCTALWHVLQSYSMLIAAIYACFGQQRLGRDVG